MTTGIKTGYSGMDGLGDGDCGAEGLGDGLGDELELTDITETLLLSE